MTLQVFGCPECSEPFQVDDGMAGQAVGCPACGAAVSIPSAAELLAAAQPEPPAPEPEPTAVECPHCNGSFGVSAEMFGQRVACPHCEVAVEIQAPADLPSLIPAIEKNVSEVDVADVEIDADVEEKDIAETAVGEGEISNFDPAVGSAHRARKKRQPAANVTPVPEDHSVDPEDVKAQEDVTPEPEPTLPQPVSFQPQPIDHWLPPRFAIPDPVRFPTRRGGEVLLPDGSGGLHQANSRLVTIMHNGQEYQLIAMTPAQRQRRKLIHNIIALVIGGALLVMALQIFG